MYILYVAVPYTHLIRLLHRLIFSAGRKFHCPFSHKVFVAPPFPRTAIISRQLGHVRRESFEFSCSATFSFDFLHLFHFVFRVFHLPHWHFKVCFANYIYFYFSFISTYFSPSFSIAFSSFFLGSLAGQPSLPFPTICAPYIVFVCLRSQVPGTVSYVAQAFNWLSISSLSLSLSLLFIYNIFLFKMKPQATPNYWWQNMLHKSSAAASACPPPCWGHIPLADPISSFSSIPSSIATRSH